MRPCRLIAELSIRFTAELSSRAFVMAGLTGPEEIHPGRRYRRSPGVHVDSPCPRATLGIKVTEEGSVVRVFQRATVALEVLEIGCELVVLPHEVIRARRVNEGAAEAIYHRVQHTQPLRPVIFFFLHISLELQVKRIEMLLWPCVWRSS